MVDIKYYETVFETQNNAGILKAELGDLIKELKQERAAQKAVPVEAEVDVKIAENKMWREWITIKGLEPISLKDIDERIIELELEKQISKFSA